MSSVVSSFVTRLEDRGVQVIETTASEVAGVLEAEIEPPAVGIDPESVPVELGDLDVEVELEPTPDDLDGAKTGITGTALAIADYGSVVIRGSPAGEEPTSLYPDTHIAVVGAASVVQGMDVAIGEIAESIRSGNRSHVIATGPSATADMGALVEGAHGPRSVTVVVVRP